MVNLHNHHRGRKTTPIAVCKRHKFDSYPVKLNHRGLLVVSIHDEV